jgi:cytochrome c oxidase subunit 3
VTSGDVSVVGRAVPGTSERTPSALSVGMVVWLSSELMFFAGLFAGYFSLRAANAEWPPEGVEIDAVRTGIATIVLVASSVTMHLAVLAAERDDRRSSIRWLGVTATLGTLFLLNQVLEYAELDFGLDDHAYGSIFYLMTGFHGLHVLGGVLFMAAVAAVIKGRRSRAPSGQTVEACGYYWHFVDAVWVAMYATIYLIR